MRRFRFVWAIGLCLGLAGCAGTQQRMAFGPGNLPGSRLAAAAPSCGCTPAQRPSIPPANPSQPVTALASTPLVPPPLPAARFFPLVDEIEGAAVDPLENPRADPLGVRTVQADNERAMPIPRDGAMERVSTAEPFPAVPPLVLKVARPSENQEGAGLQGLEPPQGDTPAPSEEPATIAAAAPPERGGAIALEYADDADPPGRPRLASDGTVRPAPRRGGDPTRYGPDPTYPAAYYPEGSAPAPSPRNREVWPVSRPWQPTLLPRVWRRLRAAVAGSAAPASSAVGEAHDVAEPGH